jgi:hypothetical protein
MNTIQNLTPHVVLAFVGIVALGAIAILIVNLTGKKSKPMMNENGFVILLSAVGIFVFLTGFALVFLSYLNLGIALLIGGALALIASIFLNVSLAKSKRASWPIVAANCISRELQKKTFSNGDGSAEGWLWQVICEVNFGGKNYTLSPQVNWSDLSQRNDPFWSEEAAARFLSQKIASNGECKLRINPGNPLVAELL